jgi:tyrosyl-tRNA synthetase
MFSKNLITTKQDKIEELVSRGVDEIIDKDHLKDRLLKGDKLRVKLGIDPTANELHLGHTVVLRKLKQFQNLGHQAVFIIGDFTAMIGDPSGRETSRSLLTKQQVKENMKNYIAEASKIIDIKKTEIRYNSEWYENKKIDFLMGLASKFTITRVLERDDFQKRLKENKNVSLLEIIYPLLQGYDSLEVKADVEIGGTDQKFNLLMGRKIQKRYGYPEQDILTVPLIEGTDGVKKMSKSLNNYISISSDPLDMFGKIMSIPDRLMVKYFTLLTDVSQNEIRELENDLLNISASKKSPKDWKEYLALELVKKYYNEEKARKAQEEWSKIFSKKELPSQIEEEEGGKLLDVVKKVSKVSVSQAKRLIKQGAVKVNKNVIKEWDKVVVREDLVQIGPKKFIKIK